MDSEDEPTMQATLKAILLSQTAMQKQMEAILHRIDNLEHSVNNTSLSSACISSSDDLKRKRRLPSELCVSQTLVAVVHVFLNTILHAIKCL